MKIAALHQATAISIMDGELAPGLRSYHLIYHASLPHGTIKSPRPIVFG